MLINARKHVKALSLTVAITALLTGCQTTNPYTGEQQTQKTAKYGGIGAVAGAIVGGITGGKEGALAGAALGGAAGAGYGYYTDKQEAALRAELRGTGVQVKRQGNNLQLVMPSNITFASSQSAIKSSFYPVLSSVVKVFKEYKDNLIEVVGHTDSTGSDKINLPLSRDRAKAVSDYLVNQGIADGRITFVGVGSSQPIASNDTKEGRAMNRRVEINLKPKPAKQ